MKKYYYLKDGQKKYYEGKIIHDMSEGTTYGFLVHQNVSEEKIPLTYYPEILAEEGWNSYFTYIDNDNNICKYTDLKSKIRKNKDNTYYLAKFKKEEIDLIKKDKVPEIPEYYTYFDKFHHEVKYNGDLSKLKYDKKKQKYYFEIEEEEL